MSVLQTNAVYIMIVHTLSPSTSRVSITIIVDLCSQIICQKSAMVVVIGPGNGLQHCMYCVTSTNSCIYDSKVYTQVQCTVTVVEWDL